jgi:glycerol-3-phosphate O-acyltransferase/dihydroxyacetone phosphate acyltransferase
MPLFYDALRTAFRVASNVFYATTQVNGLDNLPPEGEATILCFNHGNSLGDPVMLMRTTPRTISFCAKDALWKAPVFGTMVRHSGAVPVYRAKDHGAKAKDFNQDMFRAVYSALYEGR